MPLTPLETLLADRLGESALPLSRERIETWQDERLGELIEYCRSRSLFYREKLSGLTGDGRFGLSRLAELPLTTETELRRHGSGMVCVSQDRIARVITLHSSGTTGTAKRIYLSGEDLEQTLSFFHIGMQAMVSPGQTVAILLPGPTPDSTGQLLARALARMEVSGVVHGLIEEPVAAARQLAELQPEVLVGFPVQTLAVVRAAANLGRPLTRVRSVLLCSDYIASSIKERLGDLLACPVFSHYGTVETGLGGGVECTALAGCHLRESELLVEITDPLTSLPQAPGEWGEIVVTTLTRRGMPLIRYRTGDLGRLLPGSCPCGSRILRLDQVRGRLSGRLSLDHGGQLGLGDLDEVLFPLPGLLDFRAELLSDSGGETLRLSLICLPGYGEEAQRLARVALDRLPMLDQLAIDIQLDPKLRIQPGKRLLNDLREDTSP